MASGRLYRAISGGFSPVMAPSPALAATSMRAFVEVDGKLWRAVVKAADGGDRIYLQTFHRAQPHNLAAARRTLEKIDRD